MGLITNLYEFVNGTLSDGGQVTSNFNTIKNVINGNIEAVNLKDGAVNGSKLANGAVGTSKIADGAVTGGKIANSAITTSKLADLAVTLAKLAANSVNTDKIVDGAVTGDKIADNTITTAKLIDAIITTAKLADGAVNGSKLANGAVNVDKLASNIDATGKNFKASYATGAGSASSAINADKLDGYHASSFYRKSQWRYAWDDTNHRGYLQFPNGFLIQFGKIYISGLGYSYATYYKSFSSVFTGYVTLQRCSMGDANANVYCNIATDKIQIGGDSCWSSYLVLGLA